MEARKVATAIDAEKVVRCELCPWFSDRDRPHDAARAMVAHFKRCHPEALSDLARQAWGDGF